MSTTRVVGAACLAALVVVPAALSSAALAQDATRDRLSLTVRGKATQPADEVAIELTVTGSAEEATEAEKKYRTKLNQVLSALGKGDGKATADDDAPKKKKKKAPPKDEVAPKKKPSADDEEDEAPRPKKKKPAAEDEDEEAPAPKKKKKPAAEDEDEEAPAPRKAKPAPEENPKEDGAKKPDAAKSDAKPDEKKPDEKKPDAKPDEAKKDEFPFVVEVKEGGLTFGVKGGDPNQIRMRRMMNQPGGREEPEFRFSSTLSLVFKNVAKADSKALRKRIAELLDKVSEAGADTSVTAEGDGSPPVVRFAVKDAEDLKTKAYEVAMTAARRRGNHLAMLADRALGKVVSVRDQTQLPQVHRQQYNPYQYQVNAQLGEDFSTEVVMEVDLYVEFELKDKPAK